MMSLNGWAMPSAPPPSDLPAENAICAMILRGEITPERLRPLKAKHYFSDFHRDLHEAAVAVAERGGVVELEPIAVELEQRGMVGDLRAHLEEIRACAPLLTERALQARRFALIETWKRRVLLQAMVKTEAVLRVGDIDSRLARTRLQECFRELESP